MKNQITIPTQIKDIATRLKEVGVDTFLVGGFVRDFFIGENSNSPDIDLCLVGVTNKDVVTDIIRNFTPNGEVKADVGNSFPVWKAIIKGVGEVDFACARREQKSGDGHRGFQIETDGVTIEDDLKRRDLTVNSIAVNVLHGGVIDPFGGVADIANKIARPTSEAFKEDELRVLRAARFIAKFGFKASPELIEVCEKLDAHKIISSGIIPMERVKAELMKTFECPRPAVFFEFLHSVGWLGATFGELEALIGVPQPPAHHPEGCAFVHTLLTINGANTAFFRLVMLCHDLGKAVTTKVNGDKITAHGHELAGVDIAIKLLNRLKIEKRLIEKIAVLVELHGIGSKNLLSDKLLRKTLRRLDSVGLSFDDLLQVVKFDKNGRGSVEFFEPNIGQERAAELLQANCLTPIVTGAMLQAAGHKPSKLFSPLLKKALELQDRGSLTPDNWIDVLIGTDEGRALGLKKNKEN